MSFLVVLSSGCERSLERPVEDEIIFAEQASSSGLTFQHINGMSGELYFAEMMGSGVALLDYDNDGDLDIYLVQGGPLGPGGDQSEAPRPTDRLYRNDTSLDGQDVVIRFTDVTDLAGLEVTTGYGMGVSAGDFDNDGFVDLYLSNFGANQLLRNQGDGTFADVTLAAGVDDPRWSVSSAWGDVNHDGWLDLYVGNYVDFRLATHKVCRSPGGAPDYCSPLVFSPEPDSLYLNNGQGGFVDVSRRSGINATFGGALGVITADFDADGRTDIYVANDGVPNQLWINQGEGRFADNSELAGVAVNMAGSPEASMGVAAADFDNDGDEDLFMTHLDRETNTLYVNDGKGWFEDRTIMTGLGDPSLVFTGFGTGWLDFDNDGFLDLFSANGAVTRIPEQLASGEALPLKQTNQLFHNSGTGTFRDISAQAGPALSLSEVSRGAALGDIDNDGDTDIVVSNNNGPVRLLINQLGQDRGWIGARLVTGRTDALGARAALLRDKVPVSWRRAHTDGSYASSGDPRVLFALASQVRVATLLVHWPDGVRELFTDLEAGRYHELRRGSGAVVDVDRDQ